MENKSTLKSIGRIIFFLIVTGILGAGFFCGGIIVGFSADSNALAFLVWGIGIVLWVQFTRSMFWGKRTEKSTKWDEADKQEMNKHQLAIGKYITEARDSGLSDREISINLQNNGWTKGEIDNGFASVGGVRWSLDAVSG